MESANRGLIRVRVRGIYATAISKLLMDHGEFQLVNVSPVLQRRLNLPANDELPADVTVKVVEEEPSRLLVIGFPVAVDKVVSALSETLDDLIVKRSIYNLYSSIVPVKVESRNGECIVDVGGSNALLARGFECKDYPVVSVVKTKTEDKESMIVAPGLKIVGSYVIVSIGGKPRITFSEHIRDSDRRLMLTSLSVKYKETGIGVHWRSSSQAAPLEVLSNELKELAKRAEELYKQVLEGKYAKGEVVSEGEKVVLVDLPLTAKLKLDELRGKVTPTVLYHHMFKAGDQLLNELVDFSEQLLASTSGLTMEILGSKLLDYVVSKLSEQSTISILHVKPNGEVIKMRGYNPRVYRVGDKLRITVTRRISGSGIYDGLNVPKEEGDYAETTIEFNSWRVYHRYFNRKGELKGVYVNINTPPEITLNTIKYYDLYVDVVKRPDGSKEIIDEKQLIEACNKGLITKKLCEKAEREARRAFEEL